MNFPLGPQTVEGVDVIAVRSDTCKVAGLTCEFTEVESSKSPCSQCIGANDLVIFFSPPDYQRYLGLRLMGEVE
jgi:hypothetical protein